MPPGEQAAREKTEDEKLRALVPFATFNKDALQEGWHRISPNGPLPGLSEDVAGILQKVSENAGDRLKKRLGKPVKVRHVWLVAGIEPIPPGGKARVRFESPPPGSVVVGIQLGAKRRLLNVGPPSKVANVILRLGEDVRADNEWLMAAFLVAGFELVRGEKTIAIGLQDPVTCMIASYKGEKGKTPRVPKLASPKVKPQRE